ncbi:hypothetical protein Tco_0061962, partial [Tanacetum coccineum]
IELAIDIELAVVAMVLSNEILNCRTKALVCTLDMLSKLQDFMGLTLNLC